MHSTVAGVAAFATTAFAHYNFNALIVNDDVTAAYEYVRETTNSNSPITDITSQDFICNQGGLDADIMAKTSTYTVQGGDTVGFTVESDLSHPGPLHVYMSKAPDGTSAQDYDGSGDWFKVYAATTSSITDDGLQWSTYVNNAGAKNFTFTLPAELATGDYLMRAEHVGLHGASTEGNAQFFIGCAQLTVEGSGTSLPTDTVSIPGVYDGTESGILINIYYPVPTSYTDPGPATWPNSCEDHTVNFAGQSSDGDCTGSDSTSASSSSSTTTGSSSGSSSGASASGTATATASGSASSATATYAASPSGAASGSSTGTTDSQTESSGSDASYEASAGPSSDSSSSSSASSGSACALKRKRRSANKKRAHKRAN